MQSVDIVVITVALLAVVVAVLIALTGGMGHDEIGSGGLDLASPPGDAPAASGAAVRDEEIRQMVEARNARRAARGQAPVDADAEVARLQAELAPAPGADAALREEVRQLVEARNARLVARGEAPLDVEAETERRLRSLGG